MIDTCNYSSSLTVSEQELPIAPEYRLQPYKYHVYSFGLDIGISSVGWSVWDIENRKTVALGYRTFKGAENPKNGKSLAEPRRNARGSRVRLGRRWDRLQQIRALMVTSGIVTDQELVDIYSNHGKQEAASDDPEKSELFSTPFELRVKGLDKKLTKTGWVKVLIHIAKRRGFRSNKINDSADDKETGKMKKGIAANTEILKSGGYRTIGEAIQNDPKFKAHKRNKDGDYSNCCLRSELMDEINLLFEKQRKFGNEFAGEDFQKEYLEIWGAQRPFASGDDIEKMVGPCTLESNERRAPKACYTTEHFILWKQIADLRIWVNGKKRALSADEKRAVADLAYKHTKVTYKQIQTALIKLGTGPFAFDYIKGSDKKSSKKAVAESPNTTESGTSASTPTQTASDGQSDGQNVTEEIETQSTNPVDSDSVDSKKKSKRKSTPKVPKTPEEELLDKTFIELRAYHKIKVAVKKALGESEWQKIASNEDNVLDYIAQSLTYRKVEDEIVSYLKSFAPFAGTKNDKLIEAILPLNFTGASAYSLKAMRKLLPYMKDDEHSADEYTAIRLVGYDPKANRSAGKRTKYLPHVRTEDFHSPVAAKAAVQSRQVLNAMIAKYGSPTCVNIEVARDLTKSHEERQRIDEENKANAKAKEELAAEYKKIFNSDPRPSDLEKYRLCKEQDFFDPYTGKELIYRDVLRGVTLTYMEIFRSNRTDLIQIDHILPRSASGNNSFSNKVAVASSSNQNKKSRTPYQWFESNEENGIGKAYNGDWSKFEAFVKDHIEPHNTKRARNLLDKSFSSENKGMSDRNLCDTRYVTSVFADWVENNLLFANRDFAYPRVQRIPGMKTANFRSLLGLNGMKNRNKNDLHHALDAALIAAMTPDMCKEQKEFLEALEIGTQPYQLSPVLQNLSNEIKVRLAEDPVEAAKTFKLTNYTDDEIRNLKPFIGSMAPRRKVSGPGHKETIQTAKYLRESHPFIDCRELTKLKPDDLDKMVCVDDLYEAMRKNIRHLKHSEIETLGCKDKLFDMLHALTTDTKEQNVEAMDKVSKNKVYDLLKNHLRDLTIQELKDIFGKNDLFTVLRKQMKDLTADDIENVFCKSDLSAALKAHLEANDGNPKKAFKTTFRYQERDIEAIYIWAYPEKSFTVTLKELKELKLPDLERMVGKDSDPMLYEALKAQLEAHEGDGKKAFKEPFYKPVKQREGKEVKQGSIVRKVKLFTPIGDNSYIKVRNGIAGNGDMTKLEVYRNENTGKYEFIPYYVNDIILKKKKTQAASGEFIDKDYEYLFSLHKDELLRVGKNSDGSDAFFGYYKSFDINSGYRITLERIRPIKEEYKPSVNTLAIFEKYEVDVLGNYHKVKYKKKKKKTEKAA